MLLLASHEMEVLPNGALRFFVLKDPCKTYGLPRRIVLQLSLVFGRLYVR